MLSSLKIGQSEIVTTAFGADEDEDILKNQLQKYVENVNDKWGYILPTDFRKMQLDGTDDFFIIDVRKPEDYAKGHIKDAINIFWLDLLKNLDKIPNNKKILVYCYLGHTSSQAMVLLRLLGYDVTSLKFGIGEPPVAGVKIAGWKQLGYPLLK